MRHLLLAVSLTLAACASAPKAPPKEATEGHVLDVASMSFYCLMRGKILALVGVDTEGNIAAGACADPPERPQGGRQS